jgi:hypothetical protein
MVCCQWPFPVAAVRLVVVIVFRLNVTVKDFVLVDVVADTSQLLGLSGELESDLESQRAGGHQLRRQRGDGRGGQLVQLKNESGGQRA